MCSGPQNRFNALRNTTLVFWPIGLYWKKNSMAALVKRYRSRFDVLLLRIVRRDIWQRYLSGALMTRTSNCFPFLFFPFQRLRLKLVIAVNLIQLYKWQSIYKSRIYPPKKHTQIKYIKRWKFKPSLVTLKLTYSPHDFVLQVKSSWKVNFRRKVSLTSEIGVLNIHSELVYDVGIVHPENWQA